jgi:hypothetical protein
LCATSLWSVALFHESSLHTNVAFKIPHNAQVYNRPNSGAYQDALIIKEFLEAQLKKLAEDKIITEDMAKLPFLGDIPEPDEQPVEEEEEADEEEEEEEAEEDEDDDEEADDSDEGGKRKKRRGARTSAITKREGGRTVDRADDPETRKKRGRPPRVDTPMEARIKNIMKAMRKPRNSQNQLMISSFERVPDKAIMPEYHNEIKNPMAMDILKKKLKRKKYRSVDDFMKDVELMFENAKLYNEDSSQIYKDAVYLQKEARAAAEEEKKRPDTEFVMEDGRLPMPNGILHNGELWKVGDWVHIQNANDLTKPIVAQIYRTWQDTNGGQWVNACWYYRPEQTVHRFDRHFFENEVVKTGQYRDHPIDEVIDRCFVMFITRYNKGRPRNFPTDKEIYVCEARYNEEKHKLNKIKTWASCLPDEVREKDYEMDLFDQPKKMKKVPSPIAYLLKDSAKETDDLPKPEWGAENAPPKIGAVHKRPRDPKVRNKQRKLSFWRNELIICRNHLHQNRLLLHHRSRRHLLQGRHLRPVYRSKTAIHKIANTGLVTTCHSHLRRPLPRPHPPNIMVKIQLTQPNINLNHRAITTVLLHQLHRCSTCHLLLHNNIRPWRRAFPAKLSSDPRTRLHPHPQIHITKARMHKHLIIMRPILDLHLSSNIMHLIHSSTHSHPTLPTSTAIARLYHQKYIIYQIRPI